MMVGQLIYNLSILVAFAVLSDLINRFFKFKRDFNNVMQGVVFGLATIVAMMNPFVLSEGLIFDGRSIMLGLCALFFGPIAGFISLLFALIYRIYIGGSGLMVGEMVASSSTLIGLVFYFYFIRLKKKFPSIYALYLFGVIMHLVMLSIFFLLPAELASKTFKTIALTVIVSYPIATVLIGYLIKNQFLHTQLLQELETERDNLASTLNSIGEGVISVDINGKIVHINKLAEQMCEISEEIAIGKTLESVFSLNSETNILGSSLEKNTFEVVKESGKSILLFDKVYLVSASKIKYHLVCNFSPLLNRENQFLGEVITFSNLHQQDVLNQSLKQSEAMFKTIFDFSASPILILTMNGHFVETNNAFNALFGYDSDYLLQHHLSYLDITFPEDRKFGITQFNKIVENPKEILVFESRYFTKNHKIVWSIVTSSVVFGENNMPLYVVSQIVDISSRKAAEEELKNHNQHLVEITNELSIAKEKAEKSDALKTAFLGNMSHEIRTPLNGILGVAELLVDNTLDKNERTSFVQIMQSSCNRLLNTINDIIEAAKIESKQVQIVNSSFSIQILFDLLSNSFNPQFEEQGIDLKIEIDPSVDPAFLLFGDYDKLSMVLSKLLSNALKFTSQGTVSLVCTFENPNYLFIVQDTGVGIDEDYLSKIFDNFSQEDVSINRGYEGTGLGLAIAKGYINVLNGTLSVMSKKNSGTQFCVKIPLFGVNEKNQALSEISNHLTSIMQDPFCFMIAEDDDVSFFLARKILSREFGATIIRAYNGEEAIDLFAKDNSIALVLMDLKMPKIDGFECVKQIRQVNTDVPIIAVTAFAFAKDKEQAMEVGCNDYISKPYNAEFLIDKVRSFLG